MIQESSQELPNKDKRAPVPEAHWEELDTKSFQKLCATAGAEPHSRGCLGIPFLDETVYVDIPGRLVYRLLGEQRQAIENSLLELITIVYLLRVSETPLRRELIGVKELKDAHFFQGPHALNFSPLLARYGSDPEAFGEAAQRLGGHRVDIAETAYRFRSFPKIPVYYVLWAGDEEFPSNLSVLFDRSVENHMSADAIWGLVHLVNEKLLKCEP